MYSLIENSQMHMYEYLHSYTCRKLHTHTHTHTHSLVKGRAATFPNCCSSMYGRGSITLHKV